MGGKISQLKIPLLKLKLNGEQQYVRHVSTQVPMFSEQMYVPSVDVHWHSKHVAWTQAVVTPKIKEEQNGK